MGFAGPLLDWREAACEFAPALVWQLDVRYDSVECVNAVPWGLDKCGA